MSEKTRKSSFKGKEFQNTIKKKKKKSQKDRVLPFFCKK